MDERNVCTPARILKLFSEKSVIDKSCEKEIQLVLKISNQIREQPRE